VSEQTEDEYLIERLSKLLAEISVIVNGPQPMGVLWSYADLPQKVQALKDAAPQPHAVDVRSGAIPVDVMTEAREADKAFLFATLDCDKKKQEEAAKRAAFALASLIVAIEAQPQPSPQASAEDVRRMCAAMDFYAEQEGRLYGEQTIAAKERIRAALGVGRE
jgi:hypothetical protein